MATVEHALFSRWVREGDAQAFNALCSKYSGMVFATCARVLRSQVDAEDVSQECFEHLATMRKAPRGHFGPWLHRVATHKAVTRLRSDTRRRKREQGFSAAQRTHAEPEWDDVYGYVDEAIAELPRKLREPIVAHFLEGQTHDAIAKAEGVSRAAVTQRIGRGIECIRKSLARRGVVVAASALSSMMGAHLAEGTAVPANLTSSLGKLALSGAARPGLSSTSTWGGMGMSKTIAAGVLVAAGVLAAVALVYRPRVASQDTPEAGGVMPQGHLVEAERAVTPPEACPAGRRGDDARGAPNPATAQAGQAETQLAAAPESQAVLAGIVVDASGQSVPDALVFVAPSDIPPNPEEAAARTGADGRFHLDSLRPQTWMVAAYHAGNAPGWAPIQADSPRPIEVKIVLSTGGTVEGSVMADGTSVEGQKILVDYSRGGPFGSSCAVTDSGGHYRVDYLPEGKPRVVLYPKWGGDNVDKLAIVEDGQSTVVNFDLGAECALAGLVRVDGRPLAESHVNLTVFSPDGTIREFHTKTDSAGSYKFESLPRGSVVVHVTRETEGGWQNYLRRLEVAPGQTGVGDVDITSSGGSLACRIALPAKYKVFYTAVLSGEVEIPQLDIETLHKVAAYKVAEPQPGGDGSFQLDGLEPGKYTVMCAAVDGEAGYRGEVDMLANALFNTAAIEIKGDEQVPVTLSLE